jgi:hypothetical protein
MSERKSDSLSSEFSVKTNISKEKNAELEYFEDDKTQFYSGNLLEFAVELVQILIKEA